jgi:hypothetical protein
MYPLHATSRVDALLIDQPTNLRSGLDRRRPRYLVSTDRPVPVLVRPLGGGREQHGELVDWSSGGLGVCLAGEPALTVDQPAVIRVFVQRSGEWRILRGALKHLLQDDAGRWRAGFGDVHEQAPGADPPLVEVLAANSVKPGA